MPKKIEGYPTGKEKHKNVGVLVPIETVNEIENIAEKLGISYSTLYRNIFDDFLRRIDDCNAVLKKGQGLKLDHDLAISAVLSIHLEDPGPFRVYERNNKLPDHERIRWSFIPELSEVGGV